MRDLNYWFEVSQEIGLWDEPKQLEEFLADLPSCEHDYEAYDIVAALLAEAILKETEDDPFDLVVQYHIDKPAHAHFYHVHFIVADKRTGLCLTLQPSKDCATISMLATDLETVDGLNRWLDRILTHIRSVYRAYSRR